MLSQCGKCLRSPECKAVRLIQTCRASYLHKGELEQEEEQLGRVRGLLLNVRSHEQPELPTPPSRWSGPVLYSAAMAVRIGRRFTVTAATQGRTAEATAVAILTCVVMSCRRKEYPSAVMV